jgi:hypothetical protein
MKKINICCKNVLQYNFLLLEISICYFVFELLIFVGDRFMETLLVEGCVFISRRGHQSVEDLTQ